MSEDVHKPGLDHESYFGRSWTHVYYLWKLRRIMLGATVRRLLTRPPTDGARRVIDLGCGAGENLFELGDICADLPKVAWFGLDLNIRGVGLGARRSRLRVTERGMSPIRFLGGDVFRLPFADACMDLIISSEVVEHLLDPRPALTEMARVLKPAGFVFVTTPNPHNLPELIGYAIDRVSGGAFKRRYWRGYDAISAPPLTAEVGHAHVSVQRFQVWKRWLAQSGLTVVKKVRGPIVFGSPFFDRHRSLSGALIAFDPLLDILPFRFLLSSNMGILCRKLR
jgi:SAM-dependent methyltransferase